MAADIRTAFASKRYKFAEDELEDRCASLAIRHDVTPEEFAFEYERLMTIRAASGNLVTEDGLELLEHELDRTKAKRAAKRPAPSSVAILADSTNRNPTTPGRLPASASKTTPASMVPKTPSSAFHSRSQAGQVIKTLNEHLDMSSSSDAQPVEVEGRERCKVESLGSGPRRGQKYMANRIADRVMYLEQRMNGFAAALEQTQATSADKSLSNPGQEPEWVVGRIVCDSEGHLNASSVLLEGSLQRMQGCSVKLDLSQLPSYRLFPGQVVAVKGPHVAGDGLRAQQLVTRIPQPLPRSQPQALSRYASATGAAGMSMVVAAGPFTTSADIDYEPLAALLAVCRERQPDVLVLLGPFVDGEQPLLARGCVELTFEEIFESQVLAKLRDFVEEDSCRTSIVLLPSIRDVHHDPVFPQPPFQSALPGSIHTLTNPATFRVNDITIGGATHDVLKQVAAQEIAKGPTPDRMAAIASHIIGQRSYYPLYPPPLGACLDTSLGQALEMPCTPDIMLFPSDLAPFAKLVQCGASLDQAASSAGDPKTVCINPGRLVKDKSGATYAWLQVAPYTVAADAAQSAATQPDGTLPHRVDERCYVEIRRI